MAVPGNHGSAEWYSADQKEDNRPKRKKRPVRAPLLADLNLEKELGKGSPEKDTRKDPKLSKQARPETYKLAPDQLYAGEGVINLKDDVQEHVILLNEVTPVSPQSEQAPKAPDVAVPPVTAERSVERQSPEFRLPSSTAPVSPEITPPETPSELPPDRRVETSAWHRIEIDTKTGKLVEKPSLEYGEEYYRERAHEAAPLDDDVKVAAGEVALVAAASKEEPANNGGTPQIPSASTQQPLGPSASLQRSFTQRSSAAGPLWPYVLVLLVIGIALFLVLR